MLPSPGSASRADGDLVLRDVAVGFGTSFTLTGVSFEAVPGDLVGLIGPNGAGKSTLLKGVAGVLPLRAGRVTLGGRDLRSQASQVAFVPQREEVNWDFPVTAHGVVLMGRYRRVGWFRRPNPADRAIAQSALERLGLGAIGGRHISQFSGGQQQRIFLARAMAQEPAIVLLDEPFTGIDAENRTALHEVIDGFRASGAIVLMATHDLDEVSSTCSKVCFLNRKLVTFGTTATTFTRENLRATFGGQIAVLTS